MVSAAELSRSLRDERPNQDDLRREVERLRIEVELAQRGVMITEEGDDPDAALPPEAVLRGLTSPEDFVVKERTLNYSDGGRYEGEVLGNLRHGAGTFTLASGAVYAGDWRYDALEGRGKASMPDGQTYEGQWRGGKAKGQGVASYPNGSLYTGDFADDGRHGWGLQTFSTGDRYEGEWAADKIHGKGRWTHPDGSYYEGDWDEGRRTYGRHVSADGAEEYTGGWAEERRHGEGVLFRRGEFKYSGAWAAGEREGRGRCEYADGSVYEGEWRDGRREGRGTLALGAPGGGRYRYDGHWAEDAQHGEGVCVEPSGDRYLGQFARGARHGRGRCIYADGTKYEGQWREGVRWGQGACAYASGDAYAGEWARDRRHGAGACRFADGSRFRGEWEDDSWVQSGAEPGRCQAAGPGLGRAVAGREAGLSVLARDEDGNRRLCGGDDVRVALRLREGSAGVAGPVGVAAAVEDRGDGTYEATYLATIAGDYELSITLGPAEHVADSPYPLRVAPGPPCARWCRVQGAGRGRAAPGGEARFEVLAHDEFGNRCRGPELHKKLPIQARLQGPDGAEVPVRVAPQDDGRFACAYTAPPAPGYYRLHLETGGHPLPRTPYSVHVSHEEVEPDSATLLEGSGGGAAPGRGAAPGAAAAPPPPALDQSRVWERIAAAAYASDGALAGWDSDEEGGARARQTPEDAYLAAHPGVPVVDALEDIWLVSKLQRERKSKEEEAKAARLGEMRARLEAAYGPGRPPEAAAVQAAVRALLEEERGGGAGGEARQAPGTPEAGEGVAAAARGAGGKGTGAAAGRPLPRGGRALAAAAAELDELA